MSRKMKNIIMCSIIVAMIGTSTLTMYIAGKEMTDSATNSLITFGNNDRGFGGGFGGHGAPPNMDGNEDQDGMTPPDIEEKDDDTTDKRDREERPDRDNSGNRRMRPDMQNDSNESTDSTDSTESTEETKMTPPDMNNNDVFKDFNNREIQTPTISTAYYIIFGIQAVIISLTLMYLLLSGFNKKTLKETLGTPDKIIIILLSTILLTGGAIYGEKQITENVFYKEPTQVTQNNNDTITDKKDTTSTEKNTDNTTDNS